jgi:hypothetical protein
MARLALAFTLMTLLPALLIFVVAVQFLGRSVESWYDVPMERALESGLTLGRASLDALLADLQSKARSMALELADQPPGQWPGMLDRLRERSGAQEALIVAGNGRIVLASGGGFAQLVPDLPTPASLRQARSSRSYAAVEPTDASSESRGLKLRVIESITVAGQFGGEPRLHQGHPLEHDQQQQPPDECHEHGGGMLRAVLAPFRSEVLQGRHQLGPAGHPDAVDGGSLGAEVDVGGTDQFRFVVADGALEEGKPNAGLGMQARDKSRECLARAGPIVAAHTAAAIQEEIDIGRWSSRGIRRSFGQADFEEAAIVFVEPGTDDGCRGALFIPCEDEVAVGQVTIDSQSGDKVIAVLFDDHGMTGR